MANAAAMKDRLSVESFEEELSDANDFLDEGMGANANALVGETTTKTIKFE
jgi:hypothetical protein